MDIFGNVTDVELNNVSIGVTDSWGPRSFLIKDLIYTYKNENGDKMKLTIPKIRLPFGPDELPFVHKIVTTHREEFYIPTSKSGLRLEESDIHYTDSDGAEHDIKDVAFSVEIVERAVKKITVEEIEKQLGYKIEIVSEKEK